MKEHYLLIYFRDRQAAEISLCIIQATGPRYRHAEAGTLVYLPRVEGIEGEEEEARWGWGFRNGTSICWFR